MQIKIPKYVMRIIAVLFMIPLIVFSVLWLIISLPFTQRYILDVAENLIEKVLVGECSIQSFTTDFTSRARIEHIVLKDSSGHGDSITIHSVKAHFSLLPLLKKKIVFDKVLVNGLDAFLTVTPSGKLMIPALPDSQFVEWVTHRKKPSGHWSLYIGDARVIHLNATYSDSQNTFTGSIRNSVASAEIFRLDSMNLHLAVPDASYKSPWWNGTVDTIGAMGILTLKGMVLKDIFLDGSSTRVFGDGKIPFTDTGFWHFSADIVSDVKPITAIYGYVPSFVTDKGKVHAVASWDGTLRRPVLKANVIGKSMGTARFEIPSLNASGFYDGDSSLSFRLSAVTDIGLVKCSTNVHTEKLFSKPSFSQYYTGLTVDSVNLQKLNVPYYNSKYITWKTGKVSIVTNGHNFTNLPDSTSAQVLLDRVPGIVDSLVFDGSLKENVWGILSEWGRNRITANGNLQKGTSVDGTVNVTLKDLDRISKLLTGDGAHGGVTAEAQIHGKITDPDFDAQIRIDSLLWKTVYSELMDIHLIKENKTILFGPSHVILNANIDSLSSLLKTPELGGKIEVDADLNGKVTSPDIKGYVKVIDARYSSMKVDSIRGQIFIVALDSIHVDSLTMFEKMSGLKYDGDLILSKKRVLATIVPQKYIANRWVDTGNVKVDASLFGDSIKIVSEGNSLNLSLLENWIPNGDSIVGILDYTTDIGSVITNPEGVLQLSVHNPAYKNSKLSELNAQFNLVDSTVTGDATLFLSHSNIDSVKCEISLPLTKKEFWTIAKKPNRPLSVKTIAEKIDMESLLHSVLDSNWHAHGSVSCNLALQDSGRGLTIEGTLNVKADEIVNHTKKIAGRDIHATSNVSGPINLLHLNYYLTTGKVDFSNGFIDSAFFIGSATPDSIHCETARISLPQGGLLSLNGVVPLNKTDSLLIQKGLNIDFVIVKFPLKLLSQFFPENMIQSGVAQGKGHVEIGNGKPLLSGYLDIDTAKFSVENIAQKIGPVSIGVQLKNDSLIVQKIKGKWGKGSLIGNGYAVWGYKGLENAAFEMKGKNLEIEVIDMLEADVPDAHVMLTKRDKKFLIKGDIDIGSSRFYRDIKITDILPEPGSAQFKKEKTDSLLKSIDLQVSVKLLEDIIVDMNLGYFELGGDITITGDLQDPSYIGKVNVANGHVIYLDRQFEITEGSFVNYSPKKLNPTLNLKAETEVFGVNRSQEDRKKNSSDEFDDYIIYMELSGDLDNPVLKFSEKEGKLNEADIISILTFGQRLGSIGSSDLGERLKAFAGQSLLGFGTRKLEQALHMDRIDIQGDIFKLGNNKEDVKNKPTLTLSKRINPRLLLTYETALGDLTRRKISALFRLTKKIFIKGNADNEDYGVDIIFKYSK